MLLTNELRAIEDRANEATPGPWVRGKKSWDGTDIATVTGPSVEEIVQEPTTFYAYPSGSFVDVDGMEANLEFIAHARQDVPALVAEVKRLTEILRATRARILIELDDAGIEIDPDLHPADLVQRLGKEIR